MEKVDLNKLTTFYYVALEGSYQKAAMHLGIKTPYISKQITSLEESFKCKLFKRSHRSLVLTEDGEKFLKSAQIIVDQVKRLEEISNPDKEEDETIRIVTTTGITILWIVRKLKGFLELHPNYRLRIITTDEKVDFANHIADVAILPKIDSNPNIVHRKMFNFNLKLYASKEYLEKFGTPMVPKDLDHHRLITYYLSEAGHRGNVDWALTLGIENWQPRIPYLVINSAVGQIEAAIQGLGILAIPEEFPYIVPLSLVQVLPNEGVSIPVYFATPIQKLHLRKVETLETFFKGDLSDEGE